MAYCIGTDKLNTLSILQNFEKTILTVNLIELHLVFLHSNSSIIDE